jgi:ABC-type glycerol-3-phosphate transport system permease component
MQHTRPATRIETYALLVGIAVLFAFPLYYLIVTSLKTKA